MRTAQLLALAVLLSLGLWQVAAAQDAKTEPKVTLDTADQAAAEVAAEVTKQSGVQVGVVSPCTATATVKIEDAKTEAAVKSFAEAIEASWIRAYVLESAAPAVPFTADQLIGGISYQRETWWDSFTDDERREMMEGWREAGAFGGFGRGQGGPGQGQDGQPPAEGQQAQTPQPRPEFPGAGSSNMQRRLMQEAREAAAAAAAAGGQQAQPGQQGDGGRGNFAGMRLFDPVRELIIPVRSDTVTLTLEDQPLNQALLDLTTASGFVVAAGADLQGNISLQAENKPIEEVLDQIAKAVNAQWRPIYLLAVPRQLSEAEMEQRMEQQFTSRWARYWAKSPEERKADIQQQVDRITRMAERARESGRTSRLQRRGDRMLSRLQRYSAGLSTEQRRELLPLVRALGAAVNQQ